MAENNEKLYEYFKDKVLKDDEGVIYHFRTSSKDWKTSTGEVIEHSVVRHWVENGSLKAAGTEWDFDKFLEFADELLSERLGTMEKFSIETGGEVW